MIQNVSISGYKSINRLNIGCRRVNVFLGQANSGKSNILEALSLFALWSVQSFDDIRKLVRYRRVEDLFHLYDLTSNIEVEADTWKLKLRRLDASRFEVTCAQGSNQFLDWNFSENGGGGKNYNKVTPFRPYRYSATVKVVEKDLVGLWPPDGCNLVHLLKTNKPLRDTVQEVLAPYGIRPVLKAQTEKFELMEELADGTPVLYPYPLLSDTLRRSLFYLAAILTNQKAILLLEEPETRSFPYYVKYLAELIASDTRENQYFIVTHNPYLLHSLIAKVKETDLAVHVTKRVDQETRLFPVPSEALQDAIEDEQDVFFNLDRFTGVTG